MLIPEIAYAGAAVAAGAMTWAVRGRSACVFGASVHRGPRDHKAIALTFDDGPSESTPQLLDVLDGEGARCTFFQVGRNVERLPEIAKSVLARGHEIGNHTYSHAPLYLRPAQFIADEIFLAQDVMYKVTGLAPSLFRAPYGARWFGLRRVQEHFGLLGVMWTVIARDWKLDAQGIHQRIKRGVENGAIICLHDGREVQPNPEIRATIEAVKRLVPELRERGFELVTVSDLLCPKASSNA
ncbi:MAG: polysaccharide deacetylase family protein [Acidobacteria bacterium]|nr:polysaccharide deacetylase family protein [Acidobacteriota bacterium]